MCWTGRGSARGGVACVIDCRRVGIEILQFAAASLRIEAGEALAEVFARELAALEHAERLGPGLRNRRRSVTVRIACEHRARIEFAREPQVHASENDGGEQVWVGVGAGNAVLDTATRGRTVRDAE